MLSNTADSNCNDYDRTRSVDVPDHQRPDGFAAGLRREGSDIAGLRRH